MISDFSLFEINLPQLQQLYSSQTRYQYLTAKEFQNFCEALDILPELLGQEMLRKLIARVTGTSSISKSSINFSEFLEIFKQIAISSFTSAPSLKEKCRRFFAHIATRSKVHFSVTFKLKNLQRKGKLPKHKDHPSSPVRSPKPHKHAGFDKRQAGASNKDPDKEIVTVTINLGDKKSNRISNQTPDLKMHRNILLKKEEPDKDILRTYSEKFNRKNSVKRVKKRKTVKLKPVLSTIKKEFVILREKIDLKKKYQSLLKAYRFFYGNTQRTMFRTDFVKTIIFRAWKNLKIN